MKRELAHVVPAAASRTRSMTPVGFATAQATGEEHCLVDVDEDRLWEFRQRLRLVLRMVPGIETRGAIREVLQHLPMRRADAFHLLQQLTRHGEVIRHKMGSKQILFNPDSSQLSLWQLVAVMRNHALRQLVLLIDEHGRPTRRHVKALARQRWSWSPSTTQYRLQCLLEENIIKEEPGGNQDSSLMVCSPLSLLQEENPP